MDYQRIIKEIESGELRKVYILHGEESYFIDQIEQAVIKHALDESERDFNQTIVYGRDTDVQTVISYLREFPMMARRRLVVVREAQQLNDAEALTSYLEKASDTSILVFSHKHSKYDARKKLVKEAGKEGIVFLSDKIPDYKISDWIEKYLLQKGYKISPKASMLLSDFLGNDISKIVNELEKLALLVEKGTVINEVHIEENIGISKDYNLFELSNAIGQRDQVKAFTIIDYFRHNPKAGDLVPVITNLYNHFEKLLRIHFSQNKSKEHLASTLKVHPFFAAKLLESARQYPAKKAAANIQLLHEYDLKSKGVGNATFDRIELLKELAYRLMN